MSSPVTSWWYPLVSGLVCVVLLVAGVWVSQYSLDELHDLRQMERVPATVAGAVLPGETNLTGVVELAEPGRVVTSPETDTPVVYYRYHIERETRDSDGKRSWRTVENSVQRLPFVLRDETGEVKVFPNNRVQINARLDFQEQRGRMRYSEYRIHPGDTVFVLGEAVRSPSSSGMMSGSEAISISFGEGTVRPLISQWTEAEERASVGGMSVFTSWLGLLLLSCAVVFFFGVFRWHNTVAFLVGVTGVMMLALLGQGYYMLEADLEEARERVNRHVEAAALEIATLAGMERSSEQNAMSAEFHLPTEILQSLSDGDQHRIRRIRMDVARRIEAYNSAQRNFPEALFASKWGHVQLNPVELSPDEAEEFARLQAAFVPTRIDGQWITVAMLLGLLLGIGLAWYGIRAVTTKRTMENVPTSPIKGVSYGLSEIKGEVALKEKEPVYGPLSGKATCWYHYTVQEERGSGKDKKWVTIEQKTTTQSFWCVDDSGSIKVRPSGAKVFSRQKTTERSGKRRYTEEAILPGEKLYVLGSAGVDAETHETLEIRSEPDSSFPFIISTEPDNVVQYRYGRTGRWLLNLGLCGVILAALLVFASAGHFSPTDYLASALIGSGYLFVLIGILHYNDLVFLCNRADRNRANIDVALKKRSDLVHSLENVVREMAKHEAGLLERVTRLRRTASVNEEENDGRALTYRPVSNSLFALSESYPELKSHESYERMMEELVHLEDEVALMRQGYNDSVEHLNYRVLTIPDTFIARVFGFKERRFLKASG